MTQKDPKNEPRHPIRVVSARTGIPQDVIRVWERRYRCVCPPRGDSGRRLYTDEDVERLRLLKQAVCGGRRISDVAGMDCAALERLVSEDRSQAPSEAIVLASVRETSERSEQHLERAIEAIENLDRHGLYRILADASVEMSGPEFRHRLVVPLLAAIGSRWQEGSLRIVHEHMATHVIRTFLTLPRNHVDRSRAPRMIITTPPGQYHEIGALMAAAMAEEMGWDVFYLGTSLPAEEIAAAVRQTGARAVALSLCYRESDSHSFDELVRLRSLVEQDIPIFVGGHAIHSLRARLAEAGITCPDDLSAFRSALQTALTV